MLVQPVTLSKASLFVFLLNWPQKFLKNTDINMTVQIYSATITQHTHTLHHLGSNSKWITINRCTLLGKHDLAQKEAKPNLALSSHQISSTPNQEIKKMMKKSVVEIYIQP